jgi:hypothetical protein
MRMNSVAAKPSGLTVSTLIWAFLALMWDGEYFRGRVSKLRMVFGEVFRRVGNLGVAAHFRLFQRP